MVAFPRPNPAGALTGALTGVVDRSLPLAGGLASGIVVAAAFLLIPVGTLETLVWDSGVAALIPVAAPPLGITARAVLALGGGLLAAAVAWSSLFLLVGPEGLLARRPRREDGVPVVRRADAHPDAPPRKPLSAADLGVPLMEVGRAPAPTPPPPAAERPIPADLETPLAALDPDALLPEPKAPVRALPPLATVASERIETFALTPPPVAAPEPEPESEPEPAAEPAQPSIEALLRRLEQGAKRVHVAAR